MTPVVMSEEFHCMPMIAPINQRNEGDIEAAAIEAT
jgi:hypothetical protein